MIKIIFGGKGRERMRGLKDKKIIIYRTERTFDNDGIAKPAKYIPIHAGRLWAYVRQLSAEEFWANRAEFYKEEMLFVVNWRKDITARHFIEYKGVFYNIKRIDTFEGYKEDLKIYADLHATQPKAEDIEEWQE